jgi:ABC-type multidrug transport system fused ATPase/permease subunit
MFKKLLLLLSPPEQKRLGLLLIMSTITALLEMVGVASIVPFMAVLANTSLVESNIFLKTIFQRSNIFGVKTNQEFIIFLGVVVFLLLIISLAFKILTTYVQVRFVKMQEHSLGRRLIEKYLQQPYSWFLSRNSADLGKTILSEVSQVILYGINPLIELISKSMVAISLISLLVIADSKLAIITGSSLVGAYLFFFSFFRKYLDRSGKERLINNELRFTVISEAFGAVKEVKIGGLEKTYVENFSKSAKIFSYSNASADIINQLPRYILEAIVFGGVLLSILYLSAQTGSFNSAIPILSLYVFAGYRLIPALQQIYSSLTQVTFVGPSLNKLYDDLKNLKSFTENKDETVLSLKKEIVLNNIHFKYPKASRTALKDINLTIPAKSTIGLVGVTGSGKTTLVDVILGLLVPEKGTLKVDGKVITTQNVRSWQRSIGYVPQHIYLSDDTVAANIGFGIETKDINQDKVKKAAKIANLHEFIMHELPKQYETIIGERGVRLSGGQRQRIGIARALYHNHKILILDEATSSLDSQTEKAVMDAIYTLNKKITIILIAHRLTTVKNCDIIFLMEKGKLKDNGTFEELISNNKDFAVSFANYK